MPEIELIFVFIDQYALQFRYYDHEIQKNRIFVDQITKTIILVSVI